MRVLGWLAVLFGGFALLAGLGMDTTVVVDYTGRRVHNIGRMNDKSTALMVGGISLVVGVLILLLRSRSSSQAPAVDIASPSADRRACPHCAEQILVDAKVCRFCGRDVPPLPRGMHGSDHQVMEQLGIRFEDGLYCFRDERHEKLRDAVKSARITLASEGRSAS